MKEALGVCLKSETETRWSSRNDAIKVVSDHVVDTIDLLEDMSEDLDGTVETRSEAHELLARLLTYQFLTLQNFWSNVLGRIDRIQKRLQDPSMNFHDAAKDLESLGNALASERNDIVEAAILDRERLCDILNVAFEKRRSRRRSTRNETSEGPTSEAEEDMRVLMFAALDCLQHEMQTRFKRLAGLDEKFGFLLNTPKLLYGEAAGLLDQCVAFGEIYKRDINGRQLYEEISDRRMLLRVRSHLHLTRPEDLHSFIIQYGDESVFPNLRVALQLLMCIAVSIASCERSFSKLKLILTYLRASMGQDRLDDLSILSIERETTRMSDYEEVISNFASAKARKVQV